MADITEIFGTDGLSEDVKSKVQEAWENKLSEAREDISAELREEFAQRYANDKANIVEAMDKMISEVMKKEVSEFAEDKAKVVAERVAVKNSLAEHSKMLEKFVSDVLVKEVKELQEILDIPNHMVWLMPEGLVEEELRKRRVWLMELCTELGYNYTERLHIIAYGDKRGV